MTASDTKYDVHINFFDTSFDIHPSEVVDWLEAEGSEATEENVCQAIRDIVSEHISFPSYSVTNNQHLVEVIQELVEQRQQESADE